MQEMEEMWFTSLGREDPLKDGMQPLQYSCLENPMDSGAWQAACRVGKSWTPLK